MTRAIRSRPAIGTRIIWPTGIVSAPATPWSTRNPTSSGNVVDRPQASEASVKVVIEATYTRRAPNRSTSHPVSGNAAASASRYPVTTHWTEARSECSRSDNVRIAMFTIVVSSIDIRPPKTTATIVRRSIASLARPGVLALVMMRLPG